MIRDRCWVWSRNFELKKRVKDANTIKLLHKQDGVSDLYIEKICLKKVTFRNNLQLEKRHEIEHIESFSKLLSTSGYHHIAIVIDEAHGEESRNKFTFFLLYLFFKSHLISV